MSSQPPSKRCVTKDKAYQVDDDRLAIYQPTIWTHDFIDSLDTSFPINCKEKVMELERKVMTLNFDHENSNGSLSSLQLLQVIDDIERLGLCYMFRADIETALEKIGSINGDGGVEDDLHSVSLKYRLLRQHGYKVAPDFLMRFKDVHGGFMRSLQTDIKGLLSLYEASYLAFKGERDLHEAKLFATQHLMKDQENEAVNHALELPLYRRMLRLQTRWYIDAYAKRKDANPLLLELATLDFNMTQSVLKRELQQVSKWWEDIGLASKLRFIRDRVVECFFWMVGVVFEPQYHCCRVGLTKVCALITAIDDIYDVYGSLDELKIFTNAIQRWDIDAVKHIPEYQQLVFQHLYNTINEMHANSWTAQVHGVNITQILAKEWGELCEAFFVEARWTYSKCMPTLDAYLDNAWRSSSGRVILTHGYFLINHEIKNDAVQSLEKYHDLFKWSSMLFRLCNDLGTSSDEIERGKVANAITCYMHENGVCEELARQYIETLIDEAWCKLIEARVACSTKLGDPIIDIAINLARTSHCAYQYGDGHGAPNARVKDQVLSVIIKPITN